MHLGAIRTASGDYRAACQLNLSAFDLHKRAGNRWGMARALHNLGFESTHLGQYAEALDYFAEGVKLAEEMGDQRLLGDILNIFGEAYRALGQYAEATRLAQAALAARTAAGNKRGIAYSLYLLGDLAWRTGDYEGGWRYSSESRDLFIEIGLLRGLDFALNNLGNIACTLGDYGEARGQFQKVLQMNLVSDFLQSQTVPWALVGMAEVLRQEGQPEEAVVLIEQTLRHPNAWQEAKDRAVKLLAELQAIVPREVVAAAQARSRTTDLHTTVAMLVSQETTLDAQSPVSA